MKNRAITFLLLLFSVFAFAQKEKSPQELFVDAEYDLYNREYLAALQDYLAIFKNDTTNYNVAYKIGICYLEENLVSKAIKYLSIAEKSMSFKYKEGSAKERNASYEVLFELGKALQSMHEYDKAIAKYTEFKNALEVKKIYEIDLVDKQIETCKRAKILTSKPVPVEIFNLGFGVNSGESEMYPCVSDNDSVMIFARRGSKVTTSFGNKVTITTYAIFEAERFADSWKVKREITKDLQSNGAFIPVSLSPDGSTLILYRDNYNFGQMNDYDMGSLFYSEKKNGKWFVPKKFDKTINSIYWEFSGALNLDKSLLVFSSDRKGGAGGLDIYMSKKVNGKWLDPQNLGTTINSKLDEDFPYLVGDSILIFSSQSHDNMGGYDMFVSKKSKNSWSEPINLGFPINSPGDDERLAVTRGGKKYYFSALRPDGYLTFGQSDIYEITVLPPSQYEPIVVGPAYNRERTKIKNTVDTSLVPDSPVVTNATDNQSQTPSPTTQSEPVVPDEKETTNQEQILASEQGKVKEIIRHEKYPDTTVLGPIPVYEAKTKSVSDSTEVVGTVISNKSDEKKENVTVSLIDTKTLKKIAETKTDSDGTYKLSAASGDYKIVIEDEKIETKEHNIYIPLKAVSQISVESPVNDKGSNDGEYYRIKSVFFDYGKSDLTRDAQIDIERLAVLMINNQTLYIEVAGHTDSKSSAEFNQRLSLRRAQSVIDYLVMKGIDPIRFVKKGFGATTNIAINVNQDGSDNPEGRKFNRRVEIKVLNSTSTNIVVEDITVPEYLKNKHDLRYCVVLEKHNSSQSLEKFKNTGFADIKEVKVGTAFWYYSTPVPSKSEAVVMLNKAINAGYDHAEISDNFALRQHSQTHSTTREEVPADTYYTIQLLATYTPRDPAKSFKGLNDVAEFYGKDGFYRYTFGKFTTRAEAEKASLSFANTEFDGGFVISSYKLKKLVRDENTKNTQARYTIQLFALLKPMANYKERIPGVSEKKGDDGYYRYVFGEYNTWEQAEKGRKELISKGYNETFIVSMMKFR